MIRFLLDANIVTFWLKDAHRPLMHRMKEHRHSSALPSLVMHELYFGAFGSDRTWDNLAIYDDIGFPVLPFDRHDARVAGEVRSALKQIGKIIGPYDILIAGQALARDLTLVTNNMREFARVDGLKLADWTIA